jgi:hypothetical protein
MGMNEEQKARLLTRLKESGALEKPCPRCEGSIQIEQILIDVLVRENVQGPLNAATTPTAQMAAVTCTQCGYLMLFSLMQLDLHDL